MIEQDIIAHLKADATLDGLLVSSATNSKMFPIQVPQDTVMPFIAYEVSSPAVSYTDIIEEDNIQFNVFASTYIVCGNIVDQLKKLLCISDELRIGGASSIASTTYYIYSGTIIGTSEFKDPDTDLYCKVVSFSFKFKRRM